MPPHTRTKAAAPMPTYVHILDRAPEEMRPWTIAEIDEHTFQSLRLIICRKVHFNEDRKEGENLTVF